MRKIKIIVKNKRNLSEKKVLTLEEFKTEFKKELDSALQTYIRDRKHKDMFKPPYFGSQPDYKADFYFNLRWNFNNNARTPYYIDVIR